MVNNQKRKLPDTKLLRLKQMKKVIQNTSMKK